jgi:hypothetical protein
MNDDELIEQMLQIFGKIASTGQRIPVEIIQGLSRILSYRLEQGGVSAPAPQIPAGADLLWILSGGNRDAFINYLHTIPDPALNQLSRNPYELNRTINQLSQQITMPHGEVQQGIPKADLQSSNVFGFKYSPRDQKLLIKFNGKDTAGSGPVYQYDGVPAQVFKMFAAGAHPCTTDGKNKFGSWWQHKQPSLGSAMYHFIRDIYPYQKVA